LLPFYNFNKFKVSPPPTILTAPYLVLLMMSFNMAKLPALKASCSKTPNL
jgi:hypothetical protein